VSASDEREDVIVPAPTGRWRALLPMIGLAWLTLHATVPTRVHRAGADPYDERFAWRMFSDTRLRACTVDAFEMDDGDMLAIDLPHVLPAPWVSLIERNLGAVIERFLTWRCARADVDGVSTIVTCFDAAEGTSETTERAIDCESGETTLTVEEADG
jgi:hypothetical protein